MLPTLALDIGGTYLKAALLDDAGEMITEPVRYATPVGKPPAEVLEAIAEMIAPLGDYGRISIGFPGALRRGTILTAPNLGTEMWHGTDFAALATARFGKPARMANDATMHGLGVISGQGIEVVMTLGTGMGFALFRDGVPAPQIELGQHPAPNEVNYDTFVGDATYRRLGMEAWKPRVHEAISRCERLVNFDTLYLGGGNARHFAPEELPGNVILALNAAGLKGGIKLWLPEMGVIYE